MKKWAIEEDEICCRACVDECVINKYHSSVDSIISYIMRDPRIQRSPGIIRMRIQNIKAILDEWRIPNTLYVSPLIHAGRQTRLVLKAILDEQNIEIPNETY